MPEMRLNISFGLGIFVGGSIIIIGLFWVKYENDRIVRQNGSGSTSVMIRISNQTTGNITINKPSYMQVDSDNQAIPVILPGNTVIYEYRERPEKINYTLGGKNYVIKFSNENTVIIK